MELLTNTVARTADPDLDTSFEDLYRKAFPAFARYASERGASFDDAKDVFHDALVAYYEKSADPSFVVRISPEAYVSGIARHLWLRRFREQRRQVPLTTTQERGATQDDFYAGKEEVSLLKFIERTGKQCLELLHRFYYEKLSLKEIAAYLGYRTEHSAAVQKYKCIAKIRDAVKAQSLRYEDFDR